jgi:hypothetical protein
MECLFAVLQLCLFDPSAVTVIGDMSWQVSGGSRYLIGSDRYTGSLGRLEVMVTVPVSRELSLRYGLEHRSYVETDRDRGEERAVLGFIWKPFDR